VSQFYVSIGGSILYFAFYQTDDVKQVRSKMKHANPGLAAGHFITESGNQRSDRL
jgi:hypothetical protein